MPTVITCAAALNPYFNVSGVDFLIESITIDLECFDDGFATKAKERFNGYFQGLYNTYYLKYGNPTTQSTHSSTQSGGNLMVNLFHRLKDQSKKRAKNDHLGSSEYERYLLSEFLSHLWPDEFADFESAFSTSGRVLSIKRARLTPASLEMCMYLKDHLDAQDRIQNTSSLEHSLAFEENILEEEVQDNEAIPLSDEEIGLDEAASEAMSNRSSSGGENVDLTLSESE
ncbi:zinc finger BED domain-containing protein RICESLEEPER 2 [Tanacetum coccineum]